MDFKDQHLRKRADSDSSHEKEVNAINQESTPNKKVTNLYSKRYV